MAGAIATGPPVPKRRRLSASTSPAPNSAQMATAPEASAPEASAPEASAPEASAPEASAPKASVPEASAPEAAVRGPALACMPSLAHSSATVTAV